MDSLIICNMMYNLGRTSNLRPVRFQGKDEVQDEYGRRWSSTQNKKLKEYAV